MVWDTDSTPISNRQFRKLRNRLLLLYFLIVVAILETFATAVYLLVTRDRNQQLDAHLRQVAASSAGTLEIIQHEYEELTSEDKYEGYVPVGTDGMPIPITLSQLMGKYKAESASQISASPLAASNQGVEWYNAQRRLIVRDGGLFLQTLLPSDIPRRGILMQSGNVRSFTQPAYAISTTTDTPSILGYVRVTESTVTLEAELRRLRWSLTVGVFVASGLAALGGVWLTHESLKPVLQSFNQLKQFTSDASHELRNPLSAIRASIAVMQSHPERVHPADTEKLISIASASAQMSQLVDDLLLLARMDRQIPDQPGWRRIDLDELLEDLVDFYHDKAEKSQISLKYQLISDAKVNGDAYQLHRLFTNLLTNALQYTPSGGTVTLSLQRIGSHVFVTIQDTGIGIAPEHLPYIFDRFWRADQARTQYESGSGLGLAIAKTIAQRHQGNITVKSKLGQGSSFCVKLPLAG
ncbi:HAMP domain-containing histidine kinase [Thermoleptolyngbya sichuanensis A183]|uniref:histidine kinase n=1 Tax=Thermoleptolyngbya sichuanensis A183 TaxID=2737172 RepID=A0A6M8B993_9CYAN|nr:MULTISPECIES: HAMP domain-containing sensor histidine kinase [Thermoleptolyngbya]QKD82702.1 HAMP domain-containing histidine kinase [Thermoleptolyngbya sichuanensis A183]